MTDILTGLLGMVIMTTFVLLILVKVSDPALWVALIVPALLLCGVPAAWEFRAAWRARKA